MDVRAIVFPLWAVQGQVTIQQSRKDSGGPSRPTRTGTGTGLHYKTVLEEWNPGGNYLLPCVVTQVGRLHLAA